MNNVSRMSGLRSVSRSVPPSDASICHILGWIFSGTPSGSVILCFGSRARGGGSTS